MSIIVLCATLVTACSHGGAGSSQDPAGMEQARQLNDAAATLDAGGNMAGSATDTADQEQTQ